MFKNSRILFYLIITGLLANAISLFFSQLNMEAEYTEASAKGQWFAQVAFAGNGLLTLASIYSFFRYRKFFPAQISLCYVLLILLIALTSFNDIGLYLKNPGLFYYPKGIGTWINFGVLYFMAEDRYANKIIKLFKVLCFICIGFNLVRIGMLGSIKSRNEALYAIRDTTICLIWVYPFFFLDNSDVKSLSKLFKYGLMALIAFFAFAISSRSYLLIIIFYVLIKLKRDLGERKNALAIMVLTFVALIGGYYFVANLQDFNSIKGLLSIFSGRIGDDSRTSQLREFMDQFDYSRLVQGNGPSATWVWSGYPKGRYEWLDNQFILSTWWFGIQTTLVYMAYLAYGLFKKNPTNNLMISNAKIFIFFWILACGGFAIYVTFSTKLYYYFITFMIGFITLNRKSIA